jgi:hypothetical protein
LKKKALKRTCLIFILSIIIVSSGFGQRAKMLNESTHDDKAIHFGFTLGLNVMNFVIHNNYNSYKTDSLVADISQPIPGFHIQIVTNYRLGEYFDLRFLPGISFGQRNFVFYKGKGNKIENDKQRIESNYLEFPLLIKYKSKRLNNFRPYVITGGNLRVDLAKTFSEDDGIFLDLQLLNIFYEVGAGIDFYLPYFKFSTELKFSYGLNNSLNHRATGSPQYQNSIERLNSTLIMLSFHFE